MRQLLHLFCRHSFVVIGHDERRWRSWLIVLGDGNPDYAFSNLDSFGRATRLGWKIEWSGTSIFELCLDKR